MKQGTLFGWRSAKGKEKEAPVMGAQGAANASNGTAGAAVDLSMSTDEEDDDDSFTTPPPPAETSTANTSIASAASSSEHLDKKRVARELSYVDTDLTGKPAASTSQHGVDDGDLTVKSSAASGSPSKQLCHHHRAKCSTLVIGCTQLKANGDRCRAHYCANSLTKYYDLDRAAILANGRDESGNGKHVSSAEADYTWTCPKCLGECSCSACRKRPRLNSSEASRKTAKSDDAIASTSAATSAETVKPVKTKHKPSTKSFTELVQSQSNSKGKGKSKSNDTNIRDANTVPLDGFLRKVSLNDASSSKNKELNGTSDHGRKSTESKAKQQSLLPQQLNPPKVAAPPVLQPMQTRLPVNNIIARIWLYEVLVRFDVFDVTKRLLSNLDRFDAWNEDQLRVLFERLLCFLAEVSHIRVAPQGKKFGGILKTYQDHSTDPKRGEAWEAIRALCQSKNVAIPVLEDVEISLDQVANALKVQDVDPADTLLGSRSAGSRRAATTAALARVKSISAQENRKGDALSDEEDIYVSSRRSDKTRSRQVQPVSDDESDDDSDDSPRRRSARNTKTTVDVKKASPPRRSSRQNGKVLAIEEPESGVDTGDEGTSTMTGGDKSTDIEVVEAIVPTAPVDMPLFEQRIAILCAFAEFLLQKKSVADEIVEGMEKLRELEKQLKDQLKETQKQHEDEMRALTQNKIGMQRIGKGQEWAKEHEELVKAHEYDRIDLIMSIWLPMEAYKARSGPLGTDTDGNEYWQLTEFNEQMPVNAEAQWSWSLLVLGKGFPSENTDTVEDPGPQGEDVKMPDEEVAAVTSPSTNSTQSDTPRFFATNNVEEIKKIIAYVRYRQKQLDYDEMQEERRKDEEDVVAQQKRIESDVDMTKAETEESKSPSRAVAGVDRARLRERSRAKEELLQAQELRRARIDTLVQRLIHVKEYYQWHAGAQVEAEQEA